MQKQQETTIVSNSDEIKEIYALKSFEYKINYNMSVFYLLPFYNNLKTREDIEKFKTKYSSYSSEINSRKQIIDRLNYSFFGYGLVNTYIDDRDNTLVIAIDYSNTLNKDFFPYSFSYDYLFQQDNINYFKVKKEFLEEKYVKMFINNEMYLLNESDKKKIKSSNNLYAIVAELKENILNNAICVTEKQKLVEKFYQLASKYFYNLEPHIYETDEKEKTYNPLYKYLIDESETNIKENEQMLKVTNKELLKSIFE